MCPAGDCTDSCEWFSVRKALKNNRRSVLAQHCVDHQRSNTTPPTPKSATISHQNSDNQRRRGPANNSALLISHRTRFHIYTIHDPNIAHISSCVNTALMHTWNTARCHGRLMCGSQMCGGWIGTAASDMAAPWEKPPIMTLLLSTEAQTWSNTLWMATMLSFSPAGHSGSPRPTGHLPAAIYERRVSCIGCSHVGSE